MRIGTRSLFETGAANIARQQAEVSKVGEQISTGRRVITPSDDPAAAAAIVDLSAAKAKNDQFTANQATARNALSLTESLLGSLSDAWQNVKETLVSAGNASYSDSDRQSLATQLKSQRDALFAMANSRDADGRYVFAGYAGDRAPFVEGASGVQFRGDSGEREARIAAGRTMAISQTGAGLFTDIPTGNGVFQTAAATGNTGSASIDSGKVADALQLDGGRYTVAFHVAGGATTYDVLDGSGNAVATGQPYGGAKATVTIAGMQVGIQGSPADGDSFTLSPASQGSAFDALDEAIALLSKPVSSNADRARLASGLAAAGSRVDTAFNRAIDARTRAGAALNELDATAESTSSLGLRYEARLGELRDIDYAKAASEFSARQLTLQAAQQAYGKVFSGRSLFDFL